MPGLSGRKYRARAFGLRLGAGRGRGRSDEWRRQWRRRDGWGRMLRWRLRVPLTRARRQVHSSQSRLGDKVSMAIYALWNNKGGVGKSYLTFQIASEYARTHQNQKVLVIDLCPQANASSMLLGGITVGERNLVKLSTTSPRQTISGYVEQRIISPYQNPKVGSGFALNVNAFNKRIAKNLFLIVGDEELEVQASRVSNATRPGPAQAWRLVHGWISDLIADVRKSWNVKESESAVFIDCNPSFSIYTELAMSASDRLIIPFSADGSCKRAVRAVLSLLYGITSRLLRNSSPIGSTARLASV